MHAPNEEKSNRRVSFVIEEKAQTQNRRKTIFGSLFEKPTLPKDFHLAVANLEQQINEGEVSQLVVHSLLEQYNKGAEHYDKVKQRE